jgi:fermentation-respiration switch protein FrsA (DUF1100 family)
MQSTNDAQVPFWEYEKLLKRARESGVDVRTFVREDDRHFVCHDEAVFTPREDTEFADALPGFPDGLS